MAAPDFDLLVVGSGPGGYVAAIRGAQLGMKVGVVERGELGGICTNWGCIPTKALLHTAEVLQHLKDGADLGIVADNLRVDFARVIARSREVAQNQSRGVGILFKKNKIAHLAGTATLAASPGPIVDVDGKKLSAKHVVLATGTRPRSLPGMEPDGRRILTYFEAMNLPAQPRALVIVGAGAIGIEFAYFYNALGTRVTVLEVLPRILPAEDEEISAQVERSLRRQGVEIFTAARITDVKRTAEQVDVGFADLRGTAHKRTADQLLLAIGVRGNIENLGLEGRGVQTDRGFIQVDEWYRARGTDGKPVAGLYAIGDVIGPPLLAHKASAEAVACVEKIGGVAEREIRRVDYGAIPGATFCRPEVASMGLTEAQAKERGLDIRVGRFPFKVSGKGQAAKETEGMVKTLLDRKTGEVLGAHIVGGTASDLIAALTLSRSAELTGTEILHTVHAHPTFAEAIKGSIEAAYGEAIDL